MAEEDLSEASLDFSKLKVPDLKKELKLRGLSTTGNKTDLIDRLQSATKSNVSSESVDELEEDLLNDEDDDHLEASESLLENDLDENPITTKRSLEGNNKVEPPKKVKLNRNNSIILEKIKPVETSETDKLDISKTEEKKIIKLSELSAKERLEMRAKKFGVSDFSVEAKKSVRAERFSSNSGDSITSSPVDTKIDVLKQRAARFGTSASSLMSGLENKEKMEKRKLRFGSKSETNGVSQGDKAKLRLERFKEPIK